MSRKEPTSTPVELLYALSYAVRMGGKKRTFPVPGYREYVVPPLEGLWWGCEPEAPVSKKDFRWISMIRATRLRHAGNPGVCAGAGRHEKTSP